MDFFGIPLLCAILVISSYVAMLLIKGVGLILKELEEIKKILREKN